MNKVGLAKELARTLKQSGIRKKVTLPPQNFTIIDDEGTKREFKVSGRQREYTYTVPETLEIIDAALDLLENCVMTGDEIFIKGFGSFGVKWRKPRKARMPGVEDLLDIEGRYVPRFNFGDRLRRAAKIYGMKQEGKEIPDDCYMWFGKNSDDDEDGEEISFIEPEEEEFEETIIPLDEAEGDES